eukprot:gene402-biopygen8227
MYRCCPEASHPRRAALRYLHPKIGRAVLRGGWLQVLIGLY